MKVSKNFVSDSENIAELLTTSTEQEGAPFANFQKNIKKSLSSHIDKELNSKVADNKDIVKTMLAHHLSGQKAKNGLLSKKKFE